MKGTAVHAVMEAIRHLEDVARPGKTICAQPRTLINRER